MLITSVQPVVLASMSVGLLALFIGGGWLISAGLVAFRRTLGLAATGLLGLAVSLYLGMQHHAAAGASACNVSEIFNCDLVNRSVYSEVAGIPIAFLGAGFYGGVAAAGLLAGRKPAEHKLLGHLLFVTGVLSLIYSAFLAYASTQIGAFCLMCICLYGVNLIITVAGFLELRASGLSFGEGLLPGLTGKDDKSLGALTSAGLLVFIGSMVWYNSLGPTDPGAAAQQAAQANPQDPAALASLYSKTAGGLELDGTEPILGSPTAPFTVVEFADYECPHCGLVFPELHEVVERNIDVRLMFKHYPLSNVCNDQMTRAMHPNACGAAAAADCARQQGKFWELSTLMFKNQQFLAPTDLEFMAKQAGVDVAALQTCLADPRSMDAVRADLAHGNTAGVMGTPTLFLKGAHGEEWVKIEGGPEELELLIEAAREGIALLPPTAR